MLNGAKKTLDIAPRYTGYTRITTTRAMTTSPIAPATSPLGR